MRYGTEILVIGAIFLFIGAGVTSNIGGEVVKSINQSNKNNDYVNAYWKFDEGAGNTAHDSSIHDYNGIIHGATWTTGFSSYALDFDGVNDYVNFSDHAKHYLGFNRTDDLIFSFYFKSTSTDKGVIYSICRGDAYGYNPGAHIALNPNGTIEVQVWRLNCGVLMCSNGSYNDGSWHHAEIFYDGDSAHPLVDIYINGTLDISSGKYVCDFHSDNFKYAQMGRNSHELIDYFDGKIDEFKITKYPGGNDQNPPEIDGPISGDPGIEYDFTFTTYDPEEDDVEILIDWGDGTESGWLGPYSSGEIVTINHTYESDGLYEIKAKSRDWWDDSRWSDAYPIRIGNWPPSEPEISGPKHGEKFQDLTYTFTSEDYEGSDIYYYVEWGDGSNDDWFGPFPSGQGATATHRYSSEEVFEIRAKAKDTEDLESDWSEYYYISIGNEPPIVPDINGPRKGSPGVEYDYGFISDDPNGDDIFFEIDWGDGIQNITGYVHSGSETFISHTWEEKGTFTVKARACDEFEECSNWKEISVTMPRTKASNFNWIIYFLERFLNSFPIIR